MKRRDFIFGLLPAVAFSLAACGPSNSLTLLPPPPIGASSLPPPTAPTLSVVNFTDERMDPGSIGVRRDGSAFTTTGDVSLWISRALADELARNGLRVTFSMDTQMARSSNPEYLVTGIINEVWIKENSATSMTVQMRVTCTLANRKGKIWSESCNSSQTKSSLPTGSAADNLLLETLQDLIRPMAQKIIKSVESAR